MRRFDWLSNIDRERRTIDYEQDYEVHSFPPGVSRTWTLRPEEWIDRPEQLTDPEHLDRLWIGGRAFAFLVDEEDAVNRRDNERVSARIQWRRIER